MPKISSITEQLKSGKADETLKKLYSDKENVLQYQVERYLKLVENFEEFFPGRDDAYLFSTPGRTEVGGNHTDHNSGRILAAAVDLDIIAIAAKNNDGIVRIQSEGYPLSAVNISNLEPVESEQYTSTAIIRGVCARIRELGYEIGGFNAYMTSDVLKGSGLSSSAAYEVMIVTICNHLFNNGKIDDIQNAQIAQYAENRFFGKPCGLMDMTVCAVGGFVTIDFKDLLNPLVRKVDVDFRSYGYTMIIVDTGGNHANLNEDYVTLEHEMKEVARAFGGSVLREFSQDKVLGSIPFLRQKVSDRAILRAIHFYDDDQRVVDMVYALENKRFDEFLRLIIESGYSSWMLCQNCYSSKAVNEQGVSVALIASEKMLKDKGAWRVHGGGFAGTIQCFVPNNLCDTYIQTMRKIYGENSCYKLTTRTAGTVLLDFSCDSN